MRRLARCARGRGGRCRTCRGAGCCRTGSRGHAGRGAREPPGHRLRRRAAPAQPAPAGHAAPGGRRRRHHRDHRRQRPARQAEAEMCHRRHQRQIQGAKRLATSGCGSGPGGFHAMSSSIGSAASSSSASCTVAASVALRSVRSRSTSGMSVSGLCRTSANEPAFRHWRSWVASALALTPPIWPSGVSRRLHGFAPAGFQASPSRWALATCSAVSSGSSRSRAAVASRCPCAAARLNQK